MCLHSAFFSVRSSTFSDGVVLIEPFSFGNNADGFSSLIKKISPFNFVLIEDYEDSEIKCKESGCGYAQALMADKKYEDAMNVLNFIGNYENSADIKNQCYLEGAKQYHADKDYHSAITWYQSVKDYDKNADFYIDSCYNYGVQELNAGNYSNALLFLERAANYSDAKEKIKAVKYAYVSEHKNNSDNTTFSYLKELKAAGYRDSASIYKELYAWKVTVIAVNSDENDETTNKSTISKYDPVIFHFKLTGGTPSEKMVVNMKIYHPNGEVITNKTTWEMYDGATNWYGFPNGIYVNPVYGNGGKLTIKFYDTASNLIGEGYVNITS